MCERERVVSGCVYVRVRVPACALVYMTNSHTINRDDIDKGVNEIT